MKLNTPLSLASVFLLVGSSYADIINGQNYSWPAVADSVRDFSSTQGTNNWTYGYYDRGADPGGVYNDADFETLNEGGWQTYSLRATAGAPWTMISDGLGGHPNSVGNGGEHYAVRRFTVPAGVSGEYVIRWSLADQAAAGQCGDGVGGFLYQNGTVLDSAIVGANDAIGVRRNVSVTLNPGDFIDLALTPNDPNNDGCDGSNFGFSILAANFTTFTTTAKIADSAMEWGGVQGANGWTNGYYNVTLNGAPDPGGGDFIPFDLSAWNGTGYDLNPAASGPWTELYQTGTHPNGTNSAPGQDHWTTRRYEIQPGEAGDILLEYDVAKTNPNGGDGVGIKILLNGVEIDDSFVAYNETALLTQHLKIEGVDVGDKIDIALIPLANDGSDGSQFSARIYSLAVPEPSFLAFLGLGLAAVRRRRS